jgi:hypothetical protein
MSHWLVKHPTPTKLHAPNQMYKAFNRHSIVSQTQVLIGVQSIQKKITRFPLETTEYAKTMILS